MGYIHLTLRVRGNDRVRGARPQPRWKAVLVSEERANQLFVAHDAVSNHESDLTNSINKCMAFSLVKKTSCFNHHESIKTLLSLLGIIAIGTEVRVIIRLRGFSTENSIKLDKRDYLMLY